MAFSSVPFLLFFLPVFLLFYATPFRNAVLLVGSILFYAWGEPSRVPLLLAFIVLNWGFGLRAHRRNVLAIGIAANLGLLIWFKYASFVVVQTDRLLGFANLPCLPIPGVALPLGVSFFAFQGISYLIDVGRGTVLPQRSLFRYATYKSMFPPLIAGPIVRYSSVAGDLGRRIVSRTDWEEGVSLFCIGLGQKVLLANTIAGPVDRVFGLPAEQLSIGAAWLGTVGYALQIYFDFNGYSNMAIGLGRMLGFRLPPNFDLPYASRSVTVFWRRWHISLSSWFRDYLYIPLGGNRRGAARTVLNLLLVFLLCGLWHGAAWSFAVWGLWHGLFLVLERIGLGRALARLPAIVQHGYLLLVVVVGWVPFRAAELKDAWRHILAMAGLGSHAVDVGGAALFQTPLVATAMLAGTILSLVRPFRMGLPSADGTAGAAGAVLAGRCACLVLLVLSAARLAAGTYNPFIYFRF